MFGAFILAASFSTFGPIDVDGDRVLYATAPAPQCGRTYFGACSYPDCTWIDAEPTHELRSAPSTGGVELALASHSRGITEIWVVSGTQLLRIFKAGGIATAMVLPCSRSIPARRLCRPYPIRTR